MLLPIGFRTPVRFPNGTFVLTFCQRSNVRNVALVTLWQFIGSGGRAPIFFETEWGRCYTRAHMGTDLLLGKDIR
jgi:hypothetical protein